MRTNLLPTRCYMNSGVAVPSEAANADGYAYRRPTDSEMQHRYYNLDRAVLMVDRTDETAVGPLQLIVKRGGRPLAFAASNDRALDCPEGQVTVFGPLDSSEFGQNDGSFLLDWSTTPTGTKVSAFMLPKTAL